MPLLQPQQALEQACVDAILAAGLGYTANTCARTFDGRPPPSCGPVFVAVWGGGGKQKGRGSVASLDQMFRLSVTVTVRSNTPFDRQVKHRDEAEARLNAVVALIDRDALNAGVVNAAESLAQLRNSGAAGALPVGWSQALAWDGTDDCREVGAEWFLARGNERHAGVAQTARFGHARLTQSQANSQ